MKKFALGLSLLSSDVLNAQGALVSITSSAAPTIQNPTDPSTKKTTTTQPKGPDSDADLSDDEALAILLASTCGSSMLLTVCLARCSRRTASETTTPVTTTNSQEQLQSADITVDIMDINQEQSATPRSTTSSMTAETIGAEIRI